MESELDLLSVNGSWAWAHPFPTWVHHIFFLPWMMLERKNGFYAFEQALHIYPSHRDTIGTMTLKEWNLTTRWRSAYCHLTNGPVFFGEDIFGDQFCLSQNRIGVFRFAQKPQRLP